MKNTKNAKRGGFTLIEILVVIGIIALLATIVLVAINPARQFKQARDAQRVSNVNTILNAIGQYVADHQGIVPPGISSSSTVIGNAAGQANICSTLVPDYISAMPFDPSSGSYTDCSSYNTGYQVFSTATSGRITVSATPEIAASISVTR